jgi:hypothetical protein
MNRIYLFVAAFALLLAQSAGALDGQRQGFFYQVGVGGGTTSADQEWTVLDADFELDDSAGGVGLTYFLKADAPSLFVDVAVGVSTWDDGDGNEFGGGGVAVGAGYEFKKNWTAEVDYSFGSPSDDKSLFGEKVLVAEVTGATLGVTINHIWY